MKIRNGFVSNSSSSSFIVNFGRKVTTGKDLMDLLDFHKFRKGLAKTKEMYPEDVEDLETMSDEEVANYLCRIMDAYERHEGDAIDTFDKLVRELFYIEESVSGIRPPTTEYDEIIEKLKTNDRELVRGFEMDSEAVGLPDDYFDGKLSSEDYEFFMKFHYSGCLFDLLDKLPYAYENFH